MNIKIKVLLSLPLGQGGAVVQRRRAHVPAPRVETGAALPCWKADPSITMVCGIEIGVAGEGVPQSHMLGGLLGPASAQERGPGASQARWGGADGCREEAQVPVRDQPPPVRPVA